MAIAAVAFSAFIAMGGWKLAPALFEQGTIESVRIYRAVGCAWATLSLAFGGLAFVIDRRVTAPRLYYCYAAWWVSFVGLVLLGLNWVTGRIFCHEWGCMTMLGF